MKKWIALFALAATMIGQTACTDDTDDAYRTYEVAVRLETPELAASPLAGVEVTALGQVGTELKAATDASGVALFALPEDVYTFSATHKLSADGSVYTVNYTLQRTVSRQDFAGGATRSLTMGPIVGAGSKQIILKEIYVGGCQKDDGSGVYQFDKYVVIYNNSDQTADIKHFCISNAGPYNANASANNYVDGKLVYGEEDYTPAHAYLCYLPKNLVLEPYTSAVIALCGAIDHTATYKNSVDLSGADYVCYDPEDFWATNYHPAPSAAIPAENYLLAS